MFSYSVDEEPPAPWKPAGEEENAQDTEDEVVDASEENAELGDAPAGDDQRDAEQGEQDRADGERGEDAREADVPEDCDDADHADDERGNPEPENAEGERVGGEPADHADAERDGDEWGDHGRPEECAVNDSDKNDNEEEQHVTQDETPRWERPAHLGSRASRRAQAEPAELNDGGATDAATASFVDRAEESPEVVAARDEGVPVLGRDEAGLRTLAQILGQDTPLVARSELGLPDDLVLAASGAISGAGLTYPSLDTMLTARGMGHIDAWTLVRIGDRLGPTLAEALDEVNREIVREYAHAPRERRAARH